MRFIKKNSNFDKKTFFVIINKENCRNKEFLMENKIKKILFTTTVSAITFGGGYLVAKHNAKIEKEQLKTQIEKIFDNQIISNKGQLSAIQSEKNELHNITKDIITTAIKEQNNMSSKQQDAFYRKAIKSFTKEEIKQLNDEWKNCGGKYDIWYADLLVKWAININGNKNTASDFSKNSKNNLTDTPIKYKNLGIKRRALRTEWDNIQFVRDNNDEQDFISSVFIRTENKDAAQFYSYIMQDFIEYYNNKHNEIEYPKDENHKINNNDISEHETRMGHIHEIPNGMIPNFNLSAFKKHQKNFDKICTRLQELEKQEKQIQITQNLKKTVIASFSR